MVNSWRENGHVAEVAILMEGEWSCYRSGHFIGGRMVMLRCGFMEEECSFYRGAHFNGHMYILLYSMVNCGVLFLVYIVYLNSYL